MGEQKPPGKTPLRGILSPELTYLPTYGLLGPSSDTRRGFWFAHTCACSLYLFYKGLAFFFKVKMKATQSESRASPGTGSIKSG